MATAQQPPRPPHGHIEERHRDEDDDERGQKRQRQIRQRLAEYVHGWTHRRHPHLFHRPAFLLAHDRKRRGDDGGDHRDIRDEPGDEEQGAPQLRVVPDAWFQCHWRGHGDGGVLVSGYLRDDRLGVAHHRRRSVGVLAVDDDLHARRPVILDIAAVPGGDDQHESRLVAIDDAMELRLGCQVGDEIEVARVDERRDEGAAVGRSVAVLDGQPHVADVEVQRVAVEQQEHGRHEQQDHQREPVTPDLTQLLTCHRHDLAHHVRDSWPEDVVVRGRYVMPSLPLAPRRRETRPRAMVRPQSRQRLRCRFVPARGG